MSLHLNAKPPRNYICFKCKSVGAHWIMQCPFNYTMNSQTILSHPLDNEQCTKIYQALVQCQLIKSLQIPFVINKEISIYSTGDIKNCNNCCREILILKQCIGKYLQYNNKYWCNNCKDKVTKCCCKDRIHIDDAIKCNSNNKYCTRIMCIQCELKCDQCGITQCWSCISTVTHQRPDHHSKLHPITYTHFEYCTYCKIPQYLHRYCDYQGSIDRSELTRFLLTFTALQKSKLIKLFEIAKIEPSVINKIAEYCRGYTYKCANNVCDEIICKTKSEIEYIKYDLKYPSLQYCQKCNMWDCHLIGCRTRGLYCTKSDRCWCVKCRNDVIRCNECGWHQLMTETDELCSKCECIFLCENKQCGSYIDCNNTECYGCKRRLCWICNKALNFKCIVCNKWWCDDCCEEKEDEDDESHECWICNEYLCKEHWVKLKVNCLECGILIKLNVDNESITYHQNCKKYDLQCHICKKHCCGKDSCFEKLKFCGYCHQTVCADHYKSFQCIWCGICVENGYHESCVEHDGQKCNNCNKFTSKLITNQKY